MHSTGLMRNVTDAPQTGNSSNIWINEIFEIKKDSDADERNPQECLYLVDFFA